MTKYEQSCIVTFPAAQEKTHVVCIASSVSYSTCYNAVHMLHFYSYCVVRVAANLLKKSICGFEHKQLLASKCCLACLVCCAVLAGSLCQHIPNYFFVQGMTPLHYACGNGQLQVVQCLLRHGAKPSLKDQDVSNRLLLTAYVLSPSADTNLMLVTNAMQTVVAMLLT